MEQKGLKNQNEEKNHKETQQKPWNNNHFDIRIVGFLQVPIEICKHLQFVAIRLVLQDCIECDRPREYAHGRIFTTWNRAFSYIYMHNAPK